MLAKMSRVPKTGLCGPEQGRAADRISPGAFLDFPQGRFYRIRMGLRIGRGAEKEALG
jgi:hypothetical protein